MAGMLFHVGGKAFDTFDELTTLHYDRFAQQRLGAVRSTTAQMALAAFGSHKYAGTRQAESFGCRFVGLQL